MKIRSLFATTCAIALCNAAVLAEDVTELVLKPDAANPLMYDKKSLTAKAGTKVRIILVNKSAIPQPRNLLILKTGNKKQGHRPGQCHAHRSQCHGQKIHS